MTLSAAHPLQVLLIEDNPDDALLLRAGFAELGELHPVQWEHRDSLAGGVAALAAGAFDIVLLDLSLPDGAGAESVRILLDTAPAVSILALTGLDDDEMVNRVIAAGAQDYLVKGQDTPRMMLRAMRAARVRTSQRLALQDKERSAAHQATHDALTGLPNRVLFTDRLETALRRDLREQRGVGVAYLDLNGFKSVNDRLGHAAGDAVLRHVADTISAVLRQGDTLARLAGDEFAVVLAGAGTHAAVEAMLAHAAEHLQTHPLPIGGESLVVHFSAGAAVAPEDGRTVDALLAAADARMYRCKQALPPEQRRADDAGRQEHAADR